MVKTLENCHTWSVFSCCFRLSKLCWFTSVKQEFDPWPETLPFVSIYHVYFTEKTRSWIEESDSFKKWVMRTGENLTYTCNETLCVRGHVTHKRFMICFFPPWIRFIFLELLWEVFWLKNLLNTHTNLPEFNLWSSVIPSVTHLSSIRRGQQIGKEHQDKWSRGVNFFGSELCLWSAWMCVWLISSWGEGGVLGVLEDCDVSFLF